MTNHMEPTVTATTDPKTAARPLPADLAQVALIDAPTCAAPGDMSVSWWYAECAAGRAPQPVVRMPRCTRWRLADVRAFWIAFAERATADTQAAAQVKAHATKASAKAKANRAAKAASVAAVAQ